MRTSAGAAPGIHDEAAAHDLVAERGGRRTSVYATIVPRCKPLFPRGLRGRGRHSDRRVDQFDVRPGPRRVAAGPVNSPEIKVVARTGRVAHGLRGERAGRTGGRPIVPRTSGPCCRHRPVVSRRSEGGQSWGPSLAKTRSGSRSARHSTRPSPIASLRWGGCVCPRGPDSSCSAACGRTPSSERRWVRSCDRSSAAAPHGEVTYGVDLLMIALP
jgi:hypothetical protein